MKTLVFNLIMIIAIDYANAIPNYVLPNLKNTTKIGLIFARPESPNWITLDLYTPGVCENDADLTIQSIKLRTSGDASFLFIETALKDKQGNYELNCKPPRTNIHFTIEKITSEAQTVVQVHEGVYRIFVNSERWGDILFSGVVNKKMKYHLTPQSTDLTKLNLNTF